jgi:hypothetical protein
LACQSGEAAFGPAADCSGVMAVGCSQIAPGEYELLKGGEVGVQCVQLLFKLGDPFSSECGIAWHGEFSAEIKQPVLDQGEMLLDICGDTLRNDQSNQAVEFIGTADRLDTKVIFSYTATIAEAGGAFVAGASVDFRESVSHWSGSGLNGTPEYTQ